MSKSKQIIIVVNLILLLGYFTWSVANKEKTLHGGRLILLELAPVDPRSLMQGDYMSLNYVINDIDSMKIDKRGYCIVHADSNGVAKRVRFQHTPGSLKTGEFALSYFSTGNPYFERIHVGAESYFFEEGKGKRFENAKYGGLKIDNAGNSILIGLYDKDLHLIQ